VDLNIDMPELIPKQERGGSALPNTLFYLSIFLFLASLISFFVFNALLKNNQEDLAVLELSLSESKTAEKVALEKNILTVQRKIEDFAKLSQSHLTPSSLFQKLEENCHPKVSFNQFSLDSKSGKLVLVGKTQNFEALGQQILILKETDFVKDLILEKASISKEGQVEFSLSLTINPKAILVNE